MDVENGIDGAHAQCTQNEISQYLLQDPRAHEVIPIEADRGRFKALTWAQVSLLFIETSRAHGREERRTVRVLTAPGSIFAYVQKVVRVHRWGKEVVTCRVPRTHDYVVTSLVAE